MNSAQSSWMSTGYAGLPYGELEQLHGGSVSVLGVPVEGGQGPRIGAAPAPDILRKLSKQLEINLPGKGLDLGNLSVSGDWSARLIELVQQIARRHSKPVVLGGASDVALAVLEAFPDASVVAAMPTVRPELVARQSDTFWLINPPMFGLRLIDESSIGAQRVSWMSSHRGLCRLRTVPFSGSICRSLILVTQPERLVSTQPV